MLFASCSFRYSNHYLPVRDLYHPSALLRDLRIVGDDYDRPAGLVEGAEQLHYLSGGLGVKGSGGLVGKDHRGIVDDSPGDSNALLLPAGELAARLFLCFAQYF